MSILKKILKQISKAMRLWIAETESPLQSHQEWEENRQWQKEEDERDQEIDVDYDYHAGENLVCSMSNGPGRRPVFIPAEALGN